MENLLNQYVKIKMSGATKRNGVSYQKIIDIIEQLINRPIAKIVLLESDKRDLLIEAVQYYIKLKSYTLSEQKKLIGRIKILNSLGDLTKIESNKILRGEEEFTPETHLSNHRLNIIFNSKIGTRLPNIPFTSEASTITLPTLTHCNGNEFFAGWYDNPEFEGQVIKEINPSEYTRSISLYAKWIRILQVAR